MKNNKDYLSSTSIRVALLVLPIYFLLSLLLKTLSSHNAKVPFQIATAQMGMYYKIDIPFYKELNLLQVFIILVAFLIATIEGTKPLAIRKSNRR